MNFLLPIQGNLDDQLSAVLNSHSTGNGIFLKSLCWPKFLLEATEEDHCSLPSIASCPTTLGKVPLQPTLILVQCGRLVSTGLDAGDKVLKTKILLPRLIQQVLIIHVRSQACFLEVTRKPFYSIVSHLVQCSQTCSGSNCLWFWLVLITQTHTLKHANVCITLKNSSK